MVAALTDTREVKVDMRGEKKVEHTLGDGKSMTLVDDHSCDNTTWGHPPCQLSPKTSPSLSSCHEMTVFTKQDLQGLCSHFLPQSPKQVPSCLSAGGRKGK